MSKFHGGEALAQAVEKAYANGQTDYSLEPLVLEDENGCWSRKQESNPHSRFTEPIFYR